MIQNTDGPINVEVYPLIQQPVHEGRASVVSNVKLAASAQLRHDASKGLVARKVPLFSHLQFTHECGVAEKSGGAAMFVGRVVPFVVFLRLQHSSENSGALVGTENLTDWGGSGTVTPPALSLTLQMIVGSGTRCFHTTCT